jgi:hypothetical protein
VPGVEDRPLPVQGLAFHVTVQRRVVEVTGAKHLLRRRASHRDMQHGEPAA